VEASVEAHGLHDVTPLVMRPWVEAMIRTPLVDRPGRVVTVTSSRSGLVYVSVVTSPVVATSRTVRDDAVELDLEATGVRADRLLLTPSEGGAPRRYPLRRTGEGRWSAVVPLRELTGTGTAYDVSVRTLDGRSHPVFDAADVLEPATREPAPAQLVRSPSGGLVLRTGGMAEVRAVDFDGEVAVVALGIGGTPSAVPVLLTPGGEEIPGVATSCGDGLVEARFPLSHTSWGHSNLTRPQGQYRIAVRLADGSRAIASPARALLGVLPAEVDLERLSVTVEVFEPRAPGVRLELRPPLRGEERSERGRREIRDATRVARADRRSVFFRTLYGEATNGNGLGVHEELRRRDAPLELLWSIQDHSVPVPEGGTPVIEGTRAWYEAIQQSRYHLVDVHQLDWFERPEGQALVETMHGYPYKVMGQEWWAKGRFPVRQVANFHRRAREWTHFVSPASYATPLLREAFLDPADAHPEILEIGYPRNDVLLRPEAVEVRARARRLLGIDDDQVAVLYAPTFRDYLSVDDMTAARVTFFDTEEALRLLPDDHVLLIRGHAFNARVADQREPSRDRVVDVTDHPDVNDLILASDAAVLDYSSLRFDYVLVDRPMVFLVPDLEQYDRFRGGVIPYGPTAPGPQVTTTAEVCGHLSDLPRLREDFAEDRKRFREEYVDLEDGRAGARLVDAVMVPRGDAPPSHV
jgi:CDP-glycerol glycerophosphotransferase